MESEVVHLINFNKYARVNPNNIGELLFDQSSKSSETEFEIADILNTGRPVVSVRNVLKNLYVGVDVTKYGGANIPKAYYTVNEVRGWYEMWSGVVYPSGIIVLAIQYIEQGAEPAPYISPSLTAVRNM